MKKLIKSVLVISFFWSFSQLVWNEAESAPIKADTDSQAMGANTDTGSQPVTLHTDSQTVVANDTESKPAHKASSYTINAGDVLQITVWKEVTLDREILVLPDGTITFPLTGSFNVEGLTPAEVQEIIKDKLRSLIPSASVTVMVKATLGHAVSVIGQVTKPGEIVMGHHFTVMEALSQAGGLTPYASENNIIILRRKDDKETAIHFPYSDIVSGHNLDKDILLLPGDVVVVPTAGLL